MVQSLNDEQALENVQCFRTLACMRLIIDINRYGSGNL